MQEPLFEYYGIHLTGMVVLNGDEDDDTPDDQNEEPELDVTVN